MYVEQILHLICCSTIHVCVYRIIAQNHRMTRRLWQRLRVLSPWVLGKAPRKRPSCRLNLLVLAQHSRSSRSRSHAQTHNSRSARKVQSRPRIVMGSFIVMLYTFDGTNINAVYL